MCLNTTYFAEIMLSGFASPLIKREVIRYTDDLQVFQQHCDHCGPAPTAKIAIAATDIGEVIGQSDIKL